MDIPKPMITAQATMNDDNTIVIPSSILSILPPDTDGVRFEVGIDGKITLRPLAGEGLAPAWYHASRIKEVIQERGHNENL